MTWLDKKLAALDTETTGVDPQTAVPVSYALVELDWGRLYSVHELVNPGIPIPPETTQIHGVTDELAATGKPLAEAVEQMALKLIEWSNEGTPVVGMNLAYDLTIVDRLCREILDYSLTEVGWNGPVLDCQVLDRQFGNKFRKGPRTLSALCAHHKIEQIDAHSARGDAVACLRLVKRLGQKYRTIAANTPEWLHERQIEWRAQQMADFDAYRKEKGQDPIPKSDYEWPIQGIREPVAGGTTES